MLPSGDLEYLGRLDSQVKVRGFRIELGEIEATLGRHPEVGEKIALTRGQGADQALLAAVVVAQDAEGNPRVSAAELQRFCASSLPAFAVPRIFLVDAMPMTPTGKIDRQALLARSREVGLAEAAPQEAPAGALETLLARAFGEVLELPAADREALGRGAVFFALGGHSLLATRLLAKIAELGEGLLGGVEVPVRLIFTAPTVAGLAAAIEALAETPLAAPPGHRLAGSQQREAPRLSFAQQRLFFLHRFDPATAVYNMPAAYRLRGQLDPAALRVALETLEQRQEILRTRLREEAGVGYPELLPAAGIELPHETITAAALPARLRELGREPFDLFAEKPWRPRLLELAADDHVLFIGLHHIAGDGLSLTIFEKELAAAYRAALAGVKPELPELPWSYADFAEWQREWLAGDELERQLAFWRERVPAEPLELPTDRPRPPLPSYRGDQVERYLPASLVRELENLGRGHGATPFLTFLTPFLMLLARLSGQRQVAVGVPFSGRHRGQVDHLIGFFVNTLMLTADCGDDPSFATLLPRLREDFGRVYAHQDVPFEKLVEALEVGRDPSRNPLFQVTFQLFEKESVALDFGGLELVTLPFALGVAKLDLDLALERQADGGLRIGAEYATDLFTAATVAGWLELYEILLRALVATPAARLSQLPLLRPADRAAYEAVNATASPFPRDASLAELFAQRVAAGPELVAAEYQGRELTYRELDLASHRLACLLREHGVAPMAMVGLCFDRGLELVVAILAVVKAGAAYVPLDPDYPEARLRAMIEDTAISVVLGSAAQLARLPRLGFAALAYESLAGELARPELASRPLPPVAGGLTPAVVIFTSGSTGRPKGVVVPTRAICRLLFGTHYVELRPGDVLPQVSTASFDAYTFEI